MITDDRIEEMAAELDTAANEAYAEYDWRRIALKNSIETMPAADTTDLRFETEAWFAKFRALRNAVQALNALYA